MWFLSYCSLISQDRLPEARVVYCSATGASEPRNMGYMVRLGLWGDGTSFIDFREFLGSFLSILFPLFLRKYNLTSDHLSLSLPLFKLAFLFVSFINNFFDKSIGSLFFPFQMPIVATFWRHIISYLSN